MNSHALLDAMVKNEASDLFISVNSPVTIKANGKLIRLTKENLTEEHTLAFAKSLMSEKQMAEFTETKEANLAVDILGIGRFRLNFFFQRGKIASVVRSVKSSIPKLDSLNLPKALKDIIMEKRGLVLVVGATGSGKSTTLASMIDYRNEHSAGHILTIEDPIEFMHPNKMSIVNQREVGTDTASFDNALTNAMREAPDVILVGEILNTRTMESAIAFSETGHLCLATLHSNNADQAIERILNFFPEEAHKNALMNLSLNLKAIISQRLVPDVNGKRVPAVEVLINTPLIASYIKEGKLSEIKKAMEESLSEDIETFDQCLYRMFVTGKITQDTALNFADSREGLSLRIRLSNIQENSIGSNGAMSLQSDDPYDV